MFPEFSSEKNSYCYLVSGEVYYVTERMPANSLFHFCLFLSSDGCQILVSDQACFLKNFGHTDFFHSLLLLQFMVYKTTQNIPGVYRRLLNQNLCQACQ
jgi:hypothetical protein